LDSLGVLRISQPIRDTRLQSQHGHEPYRQSANEERRHGADNEQLDQGEAAPVSVTDVSRHDTVCALLAATEWPDTHAHRDVAPPFRFDQLTFTWL
jgi:hypothetical protein